MSAFFLVVPLLLSADPAVSEWSSAVAAILAVDQFGRGHAEATRAWPRVTELPAERLTELLAAFDGANPLAANWLRAAGEAIIQRDGLNQVSPDVLSAWVLDRRHDARGRQWAYELLVRIDSRAGEQLGPRLLDDPSAELRRDAVQRLIDKADALDPTGTQTGAVVEAYRRALRYAVDRDQVRAIAEALRRRGSPVDLPRHFGLLRQWHLIGPFDNTGGRGFSAEYPPELAIDLAAEYPGKHGPVRWSAHTLKGDDAVIDFNERLGEEKAVAAYAFARFTAPGQTEAELRLSSPNAVKVWLNGRPVAAFEIYHAGSQFDQYVARVRLKEGVNEVLVKVCQNEQTQSWARVWKLQLRVCDQAGSGIALQEPAVPQTQPSESP